MKWPVYILVLLWPSVLLADEFDDTDEMAITSAREFIRQNPVITNNVNEIGLVNLWQRIQGLQNLISILDSNPDAFKDGSDDLSLQQLRQRIASHKRYARYNGNDEQVKALVDFIQLHANIAGRYMDKEIMYSTYTEIAGFSIITGRFLAKNIWIKYGKCTREQRNPDKDKLFM